MIEKLFIPTLGRVNNQKTYNNLPEKWQKKTYLVVQDQEYDEYEEGERVEEENVEEDEDDE